MLNKDSNIPLYKQLKQKIKNDIKNNHYQIGTAIPTEQALCEKNNVSRHTVREAVSELVTEGYVERIQGKGTIVRSKRNILTRKSNTVGVIIPKITDFLIASILAGIEKVINANSHYKLLFAHTDNDIDMQNRYIKEFKEEKISGLIIFPVDDKADVCEIKNLEKENYPFVLIDRLIDGINANYVTVNNLGGSYKAVDYLVSLGHRKIGFVAHDAMDISSVKERFKGYRRVLEEYNIPFKDDYVLNYNIEDINKIDIYNKVKNYLTGPGHPTAIFAINDYMAIDLIHICYRLGIDIPEDISIIGFDDNTEFLSKINVPLTTISQPKEQLGKKAAEILIKQIEEPTRPKDQLVLATKMVIRNTCMKLS